jgi:SAM-dependent methyltransferase
LTIDRTSSLAFGRVAELYERRRPECPPDLVAWVVDRLALGPGKLVVDVGAGTGKFTRALVPSGARLVAVEPLDEMRAQLPAGIEAVAGTAEALPVDDASADAVTAAAAFHWFDPERAYPELHRVLKPDGMLCVASNSRVHDDPLQLALEEVIGPLVPSYRAIGAWRDALTATDLFAPVDEFHTTHEQLVDADGLAERIATISYVARLDDEERDAVLERVRAVGRAQPETHFPFKYRSDAYLFRPS